jgi:hypothetical protein
MTMSKNKKQNIGEYPGKSTTELSGCPSVGILDITTEKGIGIVDEAMKENADGRGTSLGVMFRREGGRVFIKPYTSDSSEFECEEGWYSLNTKEVWENLTEMNLEKIAGEDYKRYRDSEAVMLAEAIEWELTTFDTHDFFADESDVEGAIMDLVQQWIGKGLVTTYSISKAYVHFSFEEFEGGIMQTVKEGGQTRICGGDTVKGTTKVILAEIRQKIKELKFI